MLLLLTVVRRDGSFEDATVRKKWLRNRQPNPLELRPGDEILVLPRIDVKSRQIWKDVTQIIYQMAVSARVVVSL